MKFNDSKDALNWLVNNPDKRLYVDEYGNYIIWSLHSSVVEYWHFLGDYEDEDGNFYPGEWDMDRMSPDEFLKEYDNVELNTEY